MFDYAHNIMEVIINHPVTEVWKDTTQGTLDQPISLLCVAAKVLETLIQPSINNYLLLLPTNTVSDHSTQEPHVYYS